jgi:hypothetical protein
MKILVIAFKYNDIFYAASTSEFTNSKCRTLLIVSNGIEPQSFPCLDKFNKILVVNYKKDLYGILNGVRQVYAYRKYLKAEYVILSNPILVINQYVINISECKRVFLLEDGFMNYHNFIPSQSKIKQTIQILLGISNKNTYNKIKKTYLLNPSYAVYYSGEKHPLHINLKNILNLELINNIQNLKETEGKSIFIGVNLYDAGIITVEEYNKYVNSIIKELNIDIYIPHAFSSDKESVDCKKIDLSQYSITFEILASFYNFNLYSFRSTVLFTTKFINNKIKSYLIIPSFLNTDSDIAIFKKNCNDIIKL